MAEATSHVTTPQTSSTTTTRRLSFRRSLDECGLPSDSLQALEQKRKALDDSIHKYIASKEREYKQFEKELRHQARRLSAGDHNAVTTGTPSADRSAQHIDSTAGHVSQAILQHDQPVKRKSKKRHEDFAGVFTPEYIIALNHHNVVEKVPSGQLQSTPAVEASDTKDSSSTHASILRTTSDTAAIESAVRPTKLLLTQRTSSSGSSVDGKLVSALKSAATSYPDISKTKRKRVSLAVGDAIVAPSDSVPVALTVNSSSSHSRPKTRAREKQSFLTTVHQPEYTTQDTFQTDMPSHNAQTQSNEKQEPSVVAASNTMLETSRHTMKSLDGDVGDMFDLEDSDADLRDFADEQFNTEVNDDDDTSDNMVVGRICQPQTAEDSEDQAMDEIEDDTGEPPPDEEPEVALSYTGRASHSLKEPGFRRPSVSIDPIYAGRNYTRVEEGAEESGMYSSSFSRPTSKGSFTSGSLGESFMARNAEKMMDLRAQQRDNERSSRPAHALPVR